MVIDNFKRLNLKLPKRLFDQLEKIAKQNNRTVTSLLIEFISLGIIAINSKDMTIDGKKIVIIS